MFLNEVCELLVNALLKLYSNSYGRSIYLSDYAWKMFLIQFKLPPQTFLFYLQVANMENAAINSNKCLATFPLGYFLLIA